MITPSAWHPISRNSPPSLSRDSFTTVSTKTAFPSRSRVPASAIRFVSPAVPTPPGATSSSPTRKSSPPPSISSPAASTISARNSPHVSSKPISTPPTSSTSSCAASNAMIFFAGERDTPCPLASLLVIPSTKRLPSSQPTRSPRVWRSAVLCSARRPCWLEMTAGSRSPGATRTASGIPRQICNRK